MSLWGILPCSLHCLLLGSRLSVNQATAFAMGWRGELTGCDGCAWLMPEISMQMGCWTVWGWLKRFKYRVTCLIRNRRQLGNRKNNMTQRWVLHSLWETMQAWVWAEESLSNGTDYLLRVKLSAVNMLKCIMHVLFFSSCCIHPPYPGHIFNSKYSCLFHIIGIISGKMDSNLFIMESWHYSSGFPCMRSKIQDQLMSGSKCSATLIYTRLIDS